MRIGEANIETNTQQQSEKQTKQTHTLEKTSMSKKLIAIDKATTRIGWLGTGVMGRFMCEHMIKAGYKNMTVFNRTASKAEPLVQLGAHLATTPKQVAQQSDIVFTILGYPSDVEQVYFGDGGLLNNLKPGSIVVDMTTSRPSLAERIYSQAREKNIASLDAPVSGGDVGARMATLSIMLGGDGETVDLVRPLLECLGKNITHMGPAGSGQHTKMVNQILISTTMIGVVEGLIYGYRSGLDLETVIKAVGSGAAGSWSINNYGPRMLKRDFMPGFYVDHFVKDLEIALDESRRLELCLPGLALAHQLYVALKAQGHGQLGTQSLLLA